MGGKGGGGGRGEKWTKPCMHIWIIKEKWKKNVPTNIWDSTHVRRKSIVSMEKIKMNKPKENP
jgi:hypothetical protein